METICAIIRYTFKQHVRHRIYLTLGLFVFILLGGAVMVSSLGAEEQTKILLDLGLAGMEFLALVAVVFVTVQLVLEEAESRAIYLIITRPIERWQYIVGRYLGTVGAIGLGMAAMALAHAGLLLLFGWEWSGVYLVACLCSFGKILVVGALALLLSIFSTSAAAAMAFTLFFWILGHFSEEVRFMAERSGSYAVKSLVWVFYNVTPNFGYFNYRDFMTAMQSPPVEFFIWLVVYCLAYTGTCLYLSCFLFSEKEF